MRILNSITGFFQSVWQAWSLIKLIREFNAIRASFPGVDNEAKLRHWLQINANKLTTFARTTKNTVDDVIAAYIIAILDNDATWAILYNSLRLASGLFTAGAVYGSESDMPYMFDHQRIQDMENHTKCLLENTGLTPTHEQLTRITTGIILAVVTQMQA